MFLFLSAFTTTVKSTTAKGVLASAEDVGAQVGDLLLDVEVRALHQRHHGHQRSHAHGQPEHRQRRAELVRTEGIDSDPQIVSQAHHGSSPG